MVKTTLDPTGLPTAEARRDWAIRKARSIAKRKMDLESGAHRATGTSLEDALKRYWEDHPKLRERTLEIYRRAAAKLQAWAKRAGIHSADDVRGPQLVAFRAELAREPRRVHALGGKRGQQRKTKDPRSASTINIELRAVRTILGYLRKLGLLPHIDTDDLKDGLERLAVSHERGHFLKPHELQKLLDAALRHDAETFVATREEHAGEREPGSTARYEPIAPIVACALLTGMRFGEVMSLEWKQVDLDAIGSDGEVVGEIHLTAATKTKRARTVGLEVSPALRKLLAAMYLQAGTKRAVFASTRDTAEAAAKRIRREFGAPAGFTWQTLRRTCGCYLTNAPGIFGAASAYRSAKQLGHSVAVAEKHYVDVVRGIPREARTLEAAMQIEAQMTEVIATRKRSTAVTLDVKRNAS
ncbi:MAG TPA: tyrosine-type recombinase/integrase [Polyangiaceae bacterium]|nr:tyrosine-type recombinase/integrase [Polyangiaceae bacterium]